MRFLLLNGPNLNLLGTRRPDVYGSTTLPEVEEMFRGWAADAGAEADTYQSNHEGALIDRIHACRGVVDGIVFNPGAYTHTSYALHDAIESVEIPTVEVHISNVEERESWRRFSAVRPACVHTIYGRGIDGYRWGLRHLVARHAWPVSRITYGEQPDQFAELRLPAGDGPFPLVVVVHGGFWRHMWTRDTTESIAIDLARRGVASLNVEYRRVGAGGGGWTTVDDVAAAVEEVLTAPGIDRCWAAVGHSAGGQLALLAATRVSTSPRTVVSMGGVNDLELAADQDLGAGAAAAYAGDALVDLSPTRLTRLPFPIVAAHGDDDDRVPHLHAERLVEAVTRAGGKASLLTIPGGGHFDHLEPGEPAWSLVADVLVEAVAGREP